MASISTAILAADLDFALLDMPVTLTTVLPVGSVGVEFDATKESLDDGFVVEESGREIHLDTRFYLNINGVSPYPEKGWVLDDGTSEYKVNMDKIYSDGICLRLDCSARYSKGK